MKKQLVFLLFNFGLLNYSSDSYEKYNESYEKYLKNFRAKLLEDFDKPIPDTLINPRALVNPIDIINIMNEYCSSKMQFIENSRKLIHFSIKNNIDEVQKLLESNDLDIDAKKDFLRGKLNEKNEWEWYDFIESDPENSNYGITALMFASLYGHKSIVKLLLLYGANLNIQDDYKGWTALMYAVYNGDIEILELLISCGALLNIQNTNGSTALMLAAYYNRPEIADLLIRIGADVNIKNKKGKTALKIASKMKRKEIIKLLKDQQNACNCTILLKIQTNLLIIYLYL